MTLRGRKAHASRRGLGELYLDDAERSQASKISDSSIETVIYWRLLRHGLRHLYLPPSEKSTWLTVLRRPNSFLSWRPRARRAGIFMMSFYAALFPALHDVATATATAATIAVTAAILRRMRACYLVMFQFRRVNSIGHARPTNETITPVRRDNRPCIRQQVLYSISYTTQQVFILFSSCT